MKSNYARVGEMIGLRRRDGVFVVRGDTAGSTPRGGGSDIQGLMNKEALPPTLGLAGACVTAHDGSFAQAQVVLRHAF